MRKINFKDIFIPTISLFIICLFITAALAVTNFVTAPKIAENDALSQQESMKIVCPDAEKFELLTETEDGSTIYVGTVGEESEDVLKIVGYAISTVANGYGGQVKVMTGIDANGEIINIDVYYNDDETPGLGKNTSNEDFTSRFKGLTATDSIVVNKDYAGQGQQVDAVTSSTISSRAVVAAVNEACDIYKNVVAGGED
ncbi:MAG: RnfABCDGE type electron transport complex subunit G [Ruminococcus sp.]|nr:RnfABCDGE type electron transport complex subunit G [Ruminococcus sp.]